MQELDIVCWFYLPRLFRLLNKLCEAIPEFNRYILKQDEYIIELDLL